jgi:regulator of protease activity HflC (stomatin/prohibitin superfamily)
MEVLTWIAKVLAGLALLAVLLYLLIHTFFRVNENYRGLVYRGGRYVRTEKPGIGLKIPLIDTVTQVSLQQTLLSLTLKDVFGEMIAYIRYSIREHDVRAAVEQLDKPLEQIKAAAINAARPHLAGQQFEEVLAAASDIINAITTAMADFEDYGYIIEEVTIEKITPDEKTRAALAAQQAATIVNATDLIRADTEADQVRKAAMAQADRLGTETDAQEEAAAKLRQVIATIARELNMTNADAAKLMGFLLYLETVRAASGNANTATVVLPSPTSAGDLGGLFTGMTAGRVARRDVTADSH